MQEIIGNITLDYTYYAGEDLYSDGAVEDHLLKIAMDCKENLYNDVIAREKAGRCCTTFPISGRTLRSGFPYQRRTRCWRSVPDAER